MGTCQLLIPRTRERLRSQRHRWRNPTGHHCPCPNTVVLIDGTAEENELCIITLKIQRKALSLSLSLSLSLYAGVLTQSSSSLFFQAFGEEISMAPKSQAQKFGNWESGEDVSYTEYFDNVRKGKKGGKFTPNEPDYYLDAEVKGEEGPEAARPKHARPTGREDGELRRSTDSPLHSDAMSQKSGTESPHQRHSGLKYGNNKVELQAPKDVQKPRHGRQPSQEDGDFMRQTDSPMRNETANRRNSYDSPRHRHGGLSAGDAPKRGGRQSVGSDCSIEHSPLHPQTKVGGKGSGVSTPSWERKGSSEGGHGLAPLTPGRSRLRSVTRGDETPDRSPAVPKFGDWDETDPAAAEGLSHIFNRVREEKHSGEGKVPVIQNETSYPSGQKKIGTNSAKTCSCFPWSRR